MRRRRRNAPTGTETKSPARKTWACRIGNAYSIMGRRTRRRTRRGLGELDLRRLRVWAFGALCTYREMNQVAGSKAGRCLLLTRTGHVRHPLFLLPHPYSPFSPPHAETSLALRLWPETPPLSFAPRISRKSLSLSLPFILLSADFLVAKLAIITREN